MDIKRVAMLARLKLSDGELQKFDRELDQVLRYFKMIDEVSTEKTEPAFQPLEIKNVMREDKVEGGLSLTDALRNAEQKEKNYFKGPRIL